MGEEEYREAEHIVAGRNAVLEALSGEAIDKIYVKQGERHGSIIKIIAIARERGIVVVEERHGELDKLAPKQNHQGVVALRQPVSYADPKDMLSLANQRGEKPFIVILDGVFDPHNFGAVLRTCEAAGAHGVIIPKRRSVGVTPTVVKTSAGALEHIMVARVTNVTDTIQKLKADGLWIFKADMDGIDIFQPRLSPHHNTIDRDNASSAAKAAGGQASPGLDFRGAIALVFGSEGSGVSPLVGKQCDFSIKIPMFGRVNSLNLSVAAAIVIYEVVRQRQLTGASP
ncbi:MAG: 23S rRNA (guanosine(2251)-2'-O)-methyltransferase RlmB [Clostridiales bacterium]|jgi:23S rRNA (guanosine2251-2'-O)-methyltransferase|nr:23S rRNA (guanosine(2251)-2'-O)-methyltransferase RlmB [Clostridiales bacterium]